MSDYDALQDRLVKLEELFAHQEHSLGQLHEAVLKLRTEHDLLAAKYRERLTRLEALAEAQPMDPNEKPPHY